MARKNLLAGLTGEKLTAVNSETSNMAGDLAKAITTPFANFTGGRAIGAVSRSIEQIKQQAVIEIDPTLIDPSPIADRLPVLKDRAVEALDVVNGEIEQLIRNAWGRA
jgi:ParB family chromosome partitioning protein